MLGLRHLAPLAVVLVASFLYFPAPATPFWFDEVFTAHQATFRKPLGEYLRIAREDDPHPPLYYLLLRGWAEAFGGMDDGGPAPPGNEGLLRSFSSLMGVLTVAYLAFRVHPLAALLLLGSPLWASKVAEARMYPLLGFLLAVALGEGLRRPLLSAWAGLLALYTHYLALYWTPFLALLAFGKGGWRAALPYTLFLPWLPVLLEVSQKGTNAHLRPDPISNVAALGELGSYPLGLAFLALLGYAAWRKGREGRGLEALLYLVPVLAVLLWWWTGYGVNTASPRYWGTVLPPMAAAVGLALREARLPLLRGATFLGGVAGLLLILAEGGLRAYSPDEGYRVAAHLAQAALKGQEQVLVLTNEEGRGMSLAYYLRDPRVRVLYPSKDLEELGDEPWRRGYVLFHIFFPSIHLETAPPLWDLLWRLEREGCRVKAWAYGSSLVATLRCLEGGGSPGILLLR